MLTISPLNIITMLALFKKDDESLDDNMSTFLSDKEFNLLCRFVYDESGKQIGESIAVDEDILIIKSGKKYIGVPFKHIREEDSIIKVKGLIDQGNAERIGEEWLRKSFKELKIQNDNNIANGKREDAEGEKEFKI